MIATLSRLTVRLAIAVTVLLILLLAGSFIHRDFSRSLPWDSTVEPSRKIHGHMYASARGSVPRANTTHIFNQGCLSKRLGSYKPVETAATRYKHPSIVHYAKLSVTGSPEVLTFMDYMAMMSAYKFLQPSEIIVHTYEGITGKYWDLAQKWNTTVRANKIDQVRTLSGKEVYYIEHQADFIKLSSLLEYGGIMSDFDVLVINGTQIKHMQSVSECVLSLENQDLINIGFTSCVKNSSFVRRWVDKYHTDFQPESFVHNSQSMPAVFLKDNNSSICYNMFVVHGVATQPTWEQAPILWKQRNGVDWRGKVAAHYFDRSIRNFGESVLRGDSSIAELLRYVRDA